MPQTHDVGRWFWHAQRYPRLRDHTIPERRKLFTERADTREIEPPFRTAAGRLFRLWPTSWAVVVGRWELAGGEEVAQLHRAHEGRVVAADTEEIAQWPGPNVAPLPEPVDHRPTS